MLPVQQNRFGDETNALEACLATIFHLSLIDVGTIRDPEGVGTAVNLDTWLRHRGYQALVVPEAVAFSLLPSAPGFAIEIGPIDLGKREPLKKGEVAEEPPEHFVVTMSRSLVHSPHPGGRGLASVTSIVLFVKLDPHAA